jgi:hypothetical protein
MSSFVDYEDERDDLLDDDDDEDIRGETDRFEEWVNDHFGVDLEDGE